jgi:hypothetical protein
MSGQADEERVFSAGQLADMLGCSIRSIYRWEETGVIPMAQRVERGGVSARVYTASQVEEIRQKVQGRIAFAAIVREHQPRRRIRKADLKVVMRKRRRGVVEQFTAHPADAPVFLRAMKFVRRHGGCRQLAVTALDGETQTFLSGER